MAFSKVYFWVLIIAPPRGCSFQPISDWPHPLAPIYRACTLIMVKFCLLGFQVWDCDICGGHAQNALVNIFPTSAWTFLQIFMMMMMMMMINSTAHHMLNIPKQGKLNDTCSCTKHNNRKETFYGSLFFFILLKSCQFELRSFSHWPLEWGRLWLKADCAFSSLVERLRFLVMLSLVLANVSHILISFIIHVILSNNCN